MNLTAFDLASRFIGIKEIDGATHNSQILAMLHLDAKWPKGDETPWCSAFVNYIAWLCRLPRSKSLRARSWLSVGAHIPLFAAEVGSDVVVLKRGSGKQPGPSVIEAPGHVGFYAGRDSDSVFILGGNQSDSVSVAPFPISRILGVRSL